MKHRIAALALGAAVVAGTAFAALPAQVDGWGVAKSSGSSCAASGARSGNRSVVTSTNCQAVQAAVELLHSNGTSWTVCDPKAAGSSIATAQTAMTTDYWGTAWLNSSTIATHHFWAERGTL